MWILTDKEGADLPAEAVVEQFPLLVKLYGDWFDFAQAQPNGADIRFATKDGTPLAFEIDEWDAKAGEAAIWVRVPKIVGNTRQELRVFWGKTDAKSESNSAAVFNESNGYVAVWHMNDRVADATGTYPSTDTGTTSTAGMIGKARHFPGGKGIFCGDKLETLPSGSSSHSTEAWFRIERPNTTLIGWGNEGGGRGSKVRMMYRGPHHIRIDSDFADVRSQYYGTRLNEWQYVAHTYDLNDGRVYVNGMQQESSGKPTLNIKSPARLWLGGWYHNYDYVGDLDEVRISKVARSRNWLRLQHANQRPVQLLIGQLSLPGQEVALSYSVDGKAFEAVTPTTKIEIDEGQLVTLKATGGAAQAVRWTKLVPVCLTGVTEPVEPLFTPVESNRTVMKTDTETHFSVNYVLPNETKKLPVIVSVKKRKPWPSLKLVSPKTWDGRQRLELVVEVTNQEELRAAKANDFKIGWSITGIPFAYETRADRIVLKGASQNGQVTLHAIPIRSDQYGSGAEANITITLPKPTGKKTKQERPWVSRASDMTEQPEDNQFIARDDNDDGTLHYTGTLTEPAESVFVKLYADEGGKGSDNEKLIKTESSKVGADKGFSYSLAVKLKAGLVKYRAEFGSKTGNKETVLHSASNLVCGDVFLLNGQSNTVATDFGKENPLKPSDWVRTFGATAGDPNGSRLKLWANAEARSPGGKSEIGYWGMELGRRLVESQKRPVCIINGAVGGTRIDQHQRNDENPTDPSTIYGRLLWRAQQAKLTHGVRAILWHQGENDQGADGPSGDYGHHTYRDLFFDMAASWKNDYPNVGHYYVFQIWPKACSMGLNGSDNELREVQRSLPQYFSNLSVMSTLGIKPPGGCHFPAEGYAEFARLIAPVIEQKTYGRSFDKPVTPPNLKRAFFSNKARDEVTLEFDQPVIWDDKLRNEFVFPQDDRDSDLDLPKPVGAKVISGVAQGSKLVLKLDQPVASKVSYIDSARWSPDRLLYGANGLAALSFWNVELSDSE